MNKSTASRLLKGVCIAAVTLFLGYAARWMPQVTHGFAAYYTYSRMIVEGEDFSKAYDYGYFNGRVHAYGMREMMDMPNNIPTNALMLLPVAELHVVEAKIVWALISIVLLAASIIILFRVYQLSFRGELAAGLVAVIFLWRPVYDTIALGQMYFLLLFLFSLSLWGVQQSRSARSYIPLAGAFVLKGYGIVTFLWLLSSRRWKEALLTIAAVAVVVVLALPVITATAWERYYTDVVVHLGKLPTDAHTAFQTINGITNHLLTYDRIWLPFPLVALPRSYVTILSYALNLALIVYVFRRTSPRSNSSVTLSYSAAIAAGVITAPLAEEYHFVLFLPLVIGLMQHLLRGYESSKRLSAADILLLAAVIIMALPINYKALNFEPFPMIMLAYPKLYAGVVILWYAGNVMRRERLFAGNETRWIKERANPW